MNLSPDLFGRFRVIKNGKPVDERSGLIGYFARELEIEPKVAGIRLAHYKINDLYYLQSSWKDRLNRDGRESARKWWWWQTKTTKS
jgi:hypothetical protein